jgi:hypothetical protein
MSEIRLNGNVIQWDHLSVEEKIVSEDEIEALEKDGWMWMEFQGEIIATRNLKVEDGTVQLQQKSDMLGRYAQNGRHTNFGYSGYFKGYVYQGGKRRVIKNWWRLFAEKEHHFAAQKDAHNAVTRIEKIIGALSGVTLRKGEGGYFIPVEHCVVGEQTSD